MPDTPNSLSHILVHTEEPIALPGPQKMWSRIWTNNTGLLFHPDSCTCTYRGTNIAIWTSNSVVKKLEGMSGHAIEILPKYVLILGPEYGPNLDQIWTKSGLRFRVQTCLDKFWQSSTIFLKTYNFKTRNK